MTGWKMSLEELVAGSGGKLLSEKQRLFTGVGTDTRADLTGKIFVALKGDSFDAHDFLSQAVERGASALLVHRIPDQAKKLLNNVTVIEVKDTLKGLQSLSHFWRTKLGAEAKVRILGITGTNGKTTTKEFTAAILGSRFEVQYSKGSFNNHWGVPISLLSISPEHEIAVIEMGMNHPGELRELSEIAEPDAVVVTMVGRGHLEGVGSIEGAAKAKSEIYEHARPSATKIFNLDNEYTKRMFEKWCDANSARTLTFASNPQVIATDVSFQVTAEGPEALRVRGSIRGQSGEAVVPVFGQHNVTNLMTAACFALDCGMTPEEIWKALPLCRNAWGRNQWVNLASGAKVLFDAYNANPESMKAAVENFAALPAPEAGGRKLAVFGEMRELGSHTGALHKEFGESVARAGFEAVGFVGPSKAEFEAGLKAAGFSKNLFITATYEQSLAARMLPVLNRNDIVLMKGSRGMQLEKILAELSPLDFKSK